MKLDHIGNCDLKSPASLNGSLVGLAPVAARVRIRLWGKCHAAETPVASPTNDYRSQL